jgi:hypothetical protein
VTEITNDTAPDEIVGKLVPVDQTPSLFGSSDPQVFLPRVGEMANALAEVIRKQHLAVTIRGKEYVRVEGWTCLGSLVGVYAETEWTRPVEGGWEARVVAHTRYGESVGAAESMCTRSESRWRTADDYALRSMAATRATSKALRQPLGFVMALAGFEATPLEEIPLDEPTDDRPSRAQLARIRQLIADLTERDPETDWQATARELAGVSGDQLTGSLAETLIEQLERLAP